jgi:hypothetical protein
VPGVKWFFLPVAHGVKQLSIDPEIHEIGPSRICPFLSEDQVIMNYPAAELRGIKG